MLSDPLRLTPNGSLATVDDASVEGQQELVAALIMTRRGERLLLPGYGITDPAFREFEPTELAAQVAQWVPGVELLSAVPRWVDDATLSIEVEFG